MGLPAAITKSQPVPAPGENGFLCSLSNNALSLLKPHLQSVDLPAHYVIHKGGDPVEFIYFLNDGVSSLVIEDSRGHAAEIGLVGKESVAGTPGALALVRNPVTEIIQAAGHGYRLSVDRFRRLLRENNEIHGLFAEHTSLLAMTVAQIAGCNAMHKVEQRLSRWLLMVSDRIAANPIPLTQEFTAMLLGVRRQRVSAIVKSLQQKKCIKVRRESIEIINRSGLERCSCDCYSVIASLKSRPSVTR